MFAAQRQKAWMAQMENNDFGGNTEAKRELMKNFKQNRRDRIYDSKD
jgi:hypothetical protein